MLHPPLIRELDESHVVPAAALLARAMADNPTHGAVFGTASAPAPRHLQRLFRAVAGLVMARGVMLGAWREDALVGVLGMMRPGACRPGLRAWARLAATLGPISPPTLWRLARWQRVWHRAHPRAPHWHMGPFAVACDHRGHVGRRLAAAAQRRLVDSPWPIYLETDTWRNVRLYRHLGFRIIGEGDVLGVPQWFMWQAPAARGST